MATYLQQAFKANQPPGWVCQLETRLLPYQFEKLLGFAPRADVLLQREDGQRRLWIEFEISRADPVANHAKFAAIHLFQPRTEVDVFLSMISPGVDRGRQNLAANMIWVMRRIGMEAYQTVLLPHFSRQEIKQLSALSISDIAKQPLNIQPEIERALTISQSLGQADSMNIHFVANLMEVMLNLHQWNHDLATEFGRQLWGKRTVTYFIYDPRSRQFAPSKSCAYVSVPNPNAKTSAIINSIMTVQNYVQIDSAEPIFDGARAVAHLTKNLGMIRVGEDEHANLRASFNKWLAQHNDAINAHPKGPVFLIPPDWA